MVGKIIILPVLVWYNRTIKCSPHLDPLLATGGARVEVGRDSEEEVKIEDDEDEEIEDEEGEEIEQKLKLLLKSEEGREKREEGREE